MALAAVAALGTGCGDDTEPGGPDLDAGDGSAPRDDGGLDAGSDAAAPPVVRVRFKAKIGSQDLVCGQSYPDQGTTGVTVTPQDFRFFVQEVRLVTSSGREVPLQFNDGLPFQTSQVALLDFTTGEGACGGVGASTTNMVIEGTAEPGSYNGVVFVVGVPAALNHGDPLQAPAPLKAPGASWNWLGGYRFVMAELLRVGGSAMDAGSHDAGASDGGGSHGDGGAPHGGAAGVGFIHLGSTACSGTNATGFSCNRSNRPEVRLTGFDPARNTIVADLGAVFADTDLSTSVQCHGDGASCAPMFQALGIDIASGAPLATQRVFRVE